MKVGEGGNKHKIEYGLILFQQVSTSGSSDQSDGNTAAVDTKLSKMYPKCMATGAFNV
jgi:hypothetical protein